MCYFRVSALTNGVHKFRKISRGCVRLFRTHLWLIWEISWRILEDLVLRLVQFVCWISSSSLCNNCWATYVGRHVVHSCQIATCCLYFAKLKTNVARHDEYSCYATIVAYLIVSTRSQESCCLNKGFLCVYYVLFYLS